MKEHIDISFWNRGIVRCDCGKEMPFSQKDGLNMIKCTACGNPSFVPYKISKFWLYRPLGGGGMGAVYKAITEDGQIFCAVKVLPRHKRNDPEFIKNLLVEIHAAEKFGAHKNLVKLIAAGKSPEGEYFMATEFIDGERLDRYVQERHQLTEREAFSIICQIFEAEKHICACGYLFRDLKPENVMIQKDGTARLFDYGLCKPIGEEQQSAIGSSATDSDQIEGSPYYLPPERIVGATEGEYSEIYSMGMLFFYMLAGRTYYSESEINDLVVKHLTAIRIVSTGPHLRNCRSKIVTTIDKMIQRNPNSRFPDFASLDAAFKEIQKDLAGDSARDSGIKSKPETKTDDKYYDTTAEEQFPLPKNAKFAIVACVGAIILFSVAYIFFSLYSSIQKNKKIQRLRTETAKMLDIPENVAPPTMSKEEIEKIVAQKTDERMDALKESIVEFDERGVIEKICKKLKIERFSEKKPLKSIAELKAEAENLIRKKAEEEFSKAILPFDSKKATEEIISKYGLKMPLIKPSKPIEKVHDDFKIYIKSLVEENFGLKALAAEINKIHEKYSAYKPGQDVKLLLPSGQYIEGKFVADLGSKLLIGYREVLKKDLHPLERLRFDEELSAKKISELVAKTKQDFAIRKKEYLGRVEKDEESKFYASSGYFRNSIGEWVSAEELLKEQLARARAEYSIKSELTKKKIEDECYKNFDMDKFFRDSGYVMLDGKWISESEAIQEELKKERKTFEDRRDAEIRELRKKTENLIRQEIYRKNNYVFYGGAWQPANELIQKIVEKRMKEVK